MGFFAPPKARENNMEKAFAVKQIKDQFKHLGLDKDQAETIADLAASRQMAVEVFKDENPSPETVFGVYERVLAWEEKEDQDQSFGELQAAIEITGQLFPGSRDPRAVFAVFDGLYGEE